MNDSPPTGPDDGSTSHRTDRTGTPPAPPAEGPAAPEDAQDPADLPVNEAEDPEEPAPAPAADLDLDLHRLLHRSVDGLEPADGALERLRHAVPARRARKRQALVGVAAAAVLVGTAIPALVHVANAPGSTDTTVSHVGHGEETRGTAPAERQSGAPSRKTTPKPSDAPSRPAKGEGKGSTEKPVKGGGGTSGGGGDRPGSTGGGGDRPSGSGPIAPGSGPVFDNATSPRCGPTDLGSAAASLGAPGADGSVQGTFRVANVSAGNCTVDGGGSVDAVAQGSADPAQVASLTHTTGDAASGMLPAPSEEPAQLILEPGAAYEVHFAWVPSASCPGGGGTEGPSPDPSASAGETTGTGSGEFDSGTGTVTQLGGQEGLPSDGSVAVSHTADPGAPSTSTTIPNACAGTVYYTGALPAS
ncbi:hypothetical protein ACSMX9_12440 [Streptomyces sp. LE64]|uniref:hypothetical protein n=1 Tax=Streptomyces sp. LE64 TaxID=3448653 RepID=UPI0040427948